GQRERVGGSATAPTALPLPVAAPVVAPVSLPTRGDGVGPDVLLPDGASGDPEVARVGDVVLRQSDAFARLLSADPKLALSAVDLLVFDVLVAQHAEQFGVSLDADRLAELVAQEERTLREQVATELAGLPFEDYLWRVFGMRGADWRATLRRRTAQRLYQGYVLRYLALREGRVRVRFLVHEDRAVVEEVVEKVRTGADFATLARRLSEDPTKREGGLLPAFGPGFQHPAARQAFALAEGEVCEPFEASWGGASRWFAVYCLERTPGRDVPFEAVRQELDDDLDLRPVTALETTAYTMRWRPREGARAEERRP
ncbi:MAG: peptidylprolyl isomerase, partial [Planctomycetota bacterium]